MTGSATCSSSCCQRARARRRRSRASARRPPTPSPDPSPHASFSRASPPPSPWPSCAAKWRPRRQKRKAGFAPVMMWVTDASGSCTYLNPPWYEFTGRSPAEAEGSGWLDATHPDDWTVAGRAFAGADLARAGFRTEYRPLRRDGGYRRTIDPAASFSDPKVGSSAISDRSSTFTTARAPKRTSNAASPRRSQSVSCSRTWSREPTPSFRSRDRTSAGSQSTRPRLTSSRRSTACAPRRWPTSPIRVLPLRPTLIRSRRRSSISR